MVLRKSSKKKKSLVLMKPPKKKSLVLSGWFSSALCVYTVADAAPVSHLLVREQPKLTEPRSLMVPVRGRKAQEDDS